MFGLSVNKIFLAMVVGGCGVVFGVNRLCFCLGMVYTMKKKTFLVVVVITVDDSLFFKCDNSNVLSDLF